MDSKSCCTFAFATQKKGVSERTRWSDWSEVSDVVSREVYGKSLWGISSFSSFGVPDGFSNSDGALEKKTSPNIWWFQKLVVPLHSQPARKGSSLFTCEEALSWSSKRGAGLTGIIEAIFDIFHN